jgi:Kdo2-lipid IVA lauroyltransferase/acyltransferase
MLSRLLYYALIKPLSLLPFRALYALSDAAFYVVCYLIRYRRDVVMSNLRLAFPEQSEAWRWQVARRYYRHMCDLAAESIKMFSVSKDEALKRTRLTNPELTERFAEQGLSLIVTAGHYNNWELCALTSDLLVPHHVLGVYTPLRNAFMDQKIRTSRERFGMETVAKRKISEFLAANTGQLTVTLLAADQAPSPSTKTVHRMEFLGQPTEVMLGPERFSKQYGYPVLHVAMRKLRRGFYEYTLLVVEENPRDAPPGSITEGHTRLLEQQIREAPEFWLWSHKRWKHRARKPATLV